MMPRVQPAVIGMAKAVEAAAVNFGKGNFGKGRGRHDRSPLVEPKISTVITP
jgi:hypothetical protein